jgi:hypothetical protein
VDLEIIATTDRSMRLKVMNAICILI